MNTEGHVFAVSTVDGDTQYGLTKREYFALHILTGLRAAMNPGHALYEDTARMAVNQADYLMQELEK